MQVHSLRGSGASMNHFDAVDNNNASGASCEQRQRGLRIDIRVIHKEKDVSRSARAKSLGQVNLCLPFDETTKASTVPGQNKVKTLQIRAAL